MTVIQADRDAAAAFMDHFRPAGWQNAVANIPTGKADNSWSVQAFAAHRLAERARIFWWLRARADDEKPFELVEGDPPGCALSEAATYIERGELS